MVCIYSQVRQFLLKKGVHGEMLACHLIWFSVWLLHLEMFIPQFTQGFKFSSLITVNCHQ